MLKVSELRILNWVETPKGFEKILEFDRYAVTVDRCEDFEQLYSLKNIKPIPLTEEILLKCGFRKVDKSTFRITIKDDESVDHEFEIWMDYTRKHSKTFQLSYNDDTIYGNFIKHLHQLQNLYFALTNEELNIEL